MSKRFKDSFIADLQPKMPVDSLFLVKYLALQAGRDGRSYLNIILADKTGDLEARVWHKAQEVFERVQKGDFVQVQGKINIYQNRKQLVISSLNTVSAEEVDTQDFVAASAFSTEQMYRDLWAIIEGLDHPPIRQLLLNIFGQEMIKERLQRWPAGRSIHHAHQGGLLEHLLSCAQLALELSPRYKVNVNYVVAGAILQDLFKITELSDELNRDYTDQGRLIGHLYRVSEVVGEEAKKIENFPPDVLMHLQHICLSHHGEYAFGSPKIPQTSEAMLVHLIDLLDSKMASFETVKKTDQNPGHWSSFIKHLDRVIYKSPLP